MRISDAFQSIIAAYNDWDGFLSNPRYIRKGTEITWSDRSTGLRKVIIHESDVIELVNSGQYTFQIIDDGSIVQLYYNYDRQGESLLSASLAFYQSKAESKSIDEEVLMAEMGVVPIDDELVQPTNEGYIDAVGNEPVGWLRIDYDPNAKERGVIHHDCHMHISSFPNTRFIVNAIPAPRQFIEFIVAACYPEKYKSHCLEAALEAGTGNKLWNYANLTRINGINEHCILLETNPVYQQLSHFFVPSRRY